jgi:hypothetical protein
LARDRSDASAASRWRVQDSLGGGLAVLLVGLAPAVAAIWSVPWFVTQDGPAHLYNAQILSDSVGGFGPLSPFRDVYEVHWLPIPNWAGPISLAILVTWLPSWLADRIMTSVTLVGFAAAVFWLRWRVAGVRGLRVAALLASLLAMNIAWLFGFSSFMLGACLFPITLGVWWARRDHLQSGRLALVACLLALGYFCHLVSLGLTVIGLSVLAVVAPVPVASKSPLRHRLSRVAKTATCMIPLIGLGGVYLWISSRGGRMAPEWENLSDPWSPLAWVERLEWADPLTIAIRDGLPLSDRFGRAYIPFAPVVWLGVALFCWWIGRMWAGATVRGRNERAGWLSLAALLILGGVIGPDTLGASHGQYLPQRIVLLGLAGLVPVFDVDLARWPGRTVAAALTLAVGLQSLIIWDYAFYSDRTAGQIIRAREPAGQGQRIATLLVSTRSRFRANPLLHVDNWLGVDTGNIVWSNYETVYYYFPVQFRPGLERPRPGELESISIREDPNQAAERLGDWERLLSRHSSSIDVVLMWKSEPALDAITFRWFDEVERRGDVQLFRRRANRRAG